MTNEPLRAGDVVRLADGQTATVEGETAWYADSTGRHEGPWITLLPSYSHVRPEEVVAVVERNTNSCSLCGGGVTSKDPEKYPYCKSCHYSGAVATTVTYVEELSTLRGLLPEAEVVIEHTGGGCFWLRVWWDSDPNFYWCATEGEASIPDFSDGELWGIVCRYAEESVAEPEQVGEVWMNEYEGIPILTDDAVLAYEEGAKGSLSHEAIAKAILDDREILRDRGRL